MGTVFGKRYESLLLNDDVLGEVKELREIVREGFDVLGAFNWSDYVPWMSFFYDPSRIEERCSLLVPRVRKFVKSIIDEHRLAAAAASNTTSYDPDVSDSSDFVDVLLSLEGDEKLQEDDMIAVLWVCAFHYYY